MRQITSMWLKDYSYMYVSVFAIVYHRVFSKHKHKWEGTSLLLDIIRVIIPKGT